jgi:hypothetical protein
MFRQGLGDCFLLTFTTDGKTKHVMIDCGVLKGTPSSDQQMRRVAEAIRDETGGSIDVLVATHEHWDHLSGFNQASAIFDEFEIRDVWLAWTEDPEDDVANELRAHRTRARKAVEAAARRLGAAGSAIAALLDFENGLGAAGGKTTRDALDWVAAKRPKTRPFLHPGDQLSPSESNLGGGVRTYVLGPPRDIKQIKRSDPSRRTPEVYELAASGATDRAFDAAMKVIERGEEELSDQPFVRYYRVPEGAAATDEDFAGYFTTRAKWRRIDDDFLGVAGPLALALNSDTNNTSLALAFELGPGGPVLLFPGDAQVGNWLSWGDLRWTVDDGDGAPKRSVTSTDLLARTALYKVGHHGSHNATLKDHGLELMTSRDLVAMIPVNRETAHKKKWKMPFDSLFKRLLELTEGRVLDVDLGVAGTGSGARWKAFMKAKDVEDLWIDYTIEW